MTGTIRRAITRADEDEVRRRVAPLGYPVSVDAFGVLHIDRFVTKDLATAGIFPGRDGWEIEEAESAAILACRRAGMFAPTEQAAKASEPDPGDECTGCLRVVGAHELRDGGCRYCNCPAFRAAEEPASTTDAGVKPPHPRELEDVRPGVDPLSPALALRRLAMRLQPGESVDVIDRLCNDFVTALRASLPAPPMPLPRGCGCAETIAALRLESEGNDAALLAATTERNAYRAEAEALRERAARTTDGALTAYLVEHHSDAWRPGEDALALTIRLLGELTADRNAFAAEARTANVTADRLATTAATLRRERDDAQADLATLRKGVSELAAKMGAPHG